LILGSGTAVRWLGADRTLAIWVVRPLGALEWEEGAGFELACEWEKIGRGARRWLKWRGCAALPQGETHSHARGSRGVQDLASMAVAGSDQWRHCRCCPM
jgi:hypothetical protein